MGRSLLVAAALVFFLPTVAFGEVRCRITSAPTGGFNFGIYDPDYPSDTQATFAIDCPGQFQNPQLVIEGAAADGSRDLVHQTNPTERIRYRLWSGPMTSVGGGKGQYTTTVFARIDAGQDPAVGIYADVVTLTYLF